MKIKYLFVIASLFLFAAACSDDDDNPSQYTMDSAKFMQQAASSGMYEVATGMLASDKATHEDVAEFGQMMVMDHTKANNELKALAQQKGVTLPDTMDQTKIAKYVELQALTDVTFDKQYMDEMVLAHDMDVAKFDSASKYANDEDERVGGEDTAGA